MKALLATILLFAQPALAFDPDATGAVLTSAPTTDAGIVENGLLPKKGGRGLASVSDPNRALCDRMELGNQFMIKNSIKDWDDRVVTLTDKFEDCSVRVRLPDGKKAFVRFKNLEATLVPEIKCLDSHGTQICKGETVFYPQRTSSMELPEAPVAMLFEHGAAVVKDGAEFVFNVKQLGKPVDCSPQKMSVCKGDYVFAEGFKIDRKFSFEGPVLKTYTNGVVIVESDKFWKYPIDVQATRKRVESIDGNLDPSVITSRGSRGKDLPYRVMPEIVPADPEIADQATTAR